MVGAVSIAGSVGGGVISTDFAGVIGVDISISGATAVVVGVAAVVVAAARWVLSITLPMASIGAIPGDETTSSATALRMSGVSSATPYSVRMSSAYSAYSASIAGRTSATFSGVTACNAVGAVIALVTLVSGALTSATRTVGAVAGAPPEGVITPSSSPETPIVLGRARLAWINA